MAIIYCKELPKRTGNFGLNAKREYTREFDVLTDSVYYDPISVAVASGMPSIGTPYLTQLSIDLGSVVISVDPKQNDKVREKWTISVKYSSDLPGFKGQGDTPGNTNKSPEQRPPIFSLKYRKEQVSVFKDLSGNLYKNTAGQPFKPARVRNYSVALIGVEKYYLTPAFSHSVNILQSVNDSTWNGFPSETVLLENVTEDSSFVNNIEVWKYNYEFAIAPNIFPYMGDNDTYGKWNPTRILSQGSQELNAGKLQPKRDKGTTLQGPFLLDVNGHFTDTPYYQEFIEYENIDFSHIP